MLQESLAPCARGDRARLPPYPIDSSHCRPGRRKPFRFDRLSDPSAFGPALPAREDTVAPEGGSLQGASPPESWSVASPTVARGFECQLQPAPDWRLPPVQREAGLLLRPEERRA